MEMKWTGFGAIGCALALAIACSDDGRSDGVIGANDESRGAMVGPAGEAGTVGTSGQGDHGATADARHFAEKAAYAGNAEVRLGQLAGERAQSQQVKEFAQMMVRDHTKAGAELKQAMSRHDVSLPATLDDEHQRLYDRLSKLRGAEFDREYMKAMVDGHMKVESMLKGRVDNQMPADRPRGTTGTGGASKTEVDAAADQWASKALPRVEQHLQTAEQVRAALESGR
jgi:putative membrane protein